MTAEYDEKWWPEFNLTAALKNAKTPKKVIFADKIRNTLTIDAARRAALSESTDFRAGFSIYRNTPISSNIQYLFQLKEGRIKHDRLFQVPAWSSTTPALKTILFQMSLHKQESKDNTFTHKPFTLNLSKKFAARASANGKGLGDYCKRRLDNAFKSELGRMPQYWFVIEYAPVSTFTHGAQRPHIHGAILLRHDETTSANKQRTRASEAFHKAIGKTHADFTNRVINFGNHQHHARNKNIPALAAKIGWVEYCMKLEPMARLIMGSRTNLFCDNETKRQAKDVLEDLRTLWLPHSGTETLTGHELGELRIFRSSQSTNLSLLGTKLRLP